MVLDLTKSAGREVSRRRQQFQADKTDYSSASSQTVKIPIYVDTEAMDMESHYLRFDIVGSQTGGSTINFQDWAASSWIRAVRVYDKAGQQLGETLQHYNGLYRMNAELKSNNENNSSFLDVLEGAKASAVAAGTSRQYCHKFFTHIFNVKDYFPAHYIGGIRVELDLESADNVLTYDGSSPVYTLSNIAFVCDLVKMKPEAEAMIAKAVAANGLDIHYESYVGNSDDVSTATSQKFNLGVINGAVKDIQTFMILDSARDASTEDYWATFVRNNLSSYRFKLGSLYLTESEVQVSATRLAEYLAEYLKSQKVSPWDIVGDSALTLSSRFVLGQLVDRSMNEMERTAIMDRAHNRLDLELNFSSAPSAATLYTFTHTEKSLVIKGGKQIVNSL